MSVCDLGEQIQRVRLARGLTYAEAARQLGISAAHFAHIVSGRRTPSLRLVARLAGWAEVKPSALLAGLPSEPAPLVGARTPVLVARARALAAAVALWRRAVEDRSLRAEDELEIARLDAEAQAYQRVQDALRRALTDSETPIMDAG